MAYTQTRVNTTTTNNQWQPSVTALADGGWLVTWSSDSQDGSGYGVYQQRYTATGVPTGSETRVNTTTANGQFGTSVTALADGGWLVTWSSDSQDGSGYGVYQQRYTATGVPTGSETRVNTTTANNQWDPSVTALADGGWLVTWSSASQDGSGYGVYQQRYTATGVPTGSETRVNTTTANSQDDPSVTALADGGWLVTWSSDSQDGSGYGVYQQRYTATGVPTGSETRVNTTTAESQYDPSVTALADGGWLVTWSFNRLDGSQYRPDVYQQRYTATGVPTGSETKVNTTTANGQFGTSVTALADGGWLVTWSSDSQDGSGYGVYQQRYTATGVPTGSETRVNTTTAQDEWQPSVTALADGGWLVTWSGGRATDGSITLPSNIVYQQRYDANGNTNSTPTDIALSAQTAIENSGTGSVVGSLSTTDSIPGDTYTYTLLDNAGGRFALSGNNLVVANGALLDFEQTAQHTVTVRSTDQGGLTVDRTLTISVSNANEAPINVALPASTVSENSGSGTIIGELSTTDPDAGNVYTYTLLDDAGGRFAMSGNTLVVANGVLLDFEQATQHSITVRSTDQGGLTVDCVITIDVQDVNLEAAVGTAGNDILKGGAANDTLTGGEGNDTLDGGAGDDTLEGGGGDDTVEAGDGNDTIIAGHGGGNDSYAGGFGVDTIRYASTLAGVDVNLETGKARGRETNDDTLRDIENVLGGAGGDTIKGNHVSNHLSGGAGNDVLNGGLGQDMLEGGTGADRFVFSSTQESARGALRDMVVGFERGVDDIDLSLIDAEKGKGNQRFSWVDKGDLDEKFTGEAGELRFKGGVLSGDTNGDKRADFEIHIGTKIGTGDVIL